MSLLKTSLLNFIAVGIRLVSMLVLNKILALEIGPNGYGLVGQLQSAITSISAIGSAGVGTGITKYTAEYHLIKDDQRKTWVAAFFLGFICSIFVSTFLILFRNYLSLKLFNTGQYSNILVWVALCLPLYVLNTYLLAVINGFKEVELFVGANVANSLIALTVTGIFTWHSGLEGALVALAINQSITCIATIFLVRNKSWFKFRYLIGKPSGIFIIRLSQFGLIAISTSVLGPLSLIFVRDLLIENSGLAAAGYWEALNRISNLYLMLITTPLSVYYLPKLSELSEKNELMRELRQGFSVLVPVTICMALLVFLLKDYLILILFSKDFSVMKDLFMWQLVGDVVRVCAWLFSFLLISKAMVKEFILVESFVTLTFIAMAQILITESGVFGLTVAYALNNFIYLILLIIVVSSKMKF